MFSMRFLFLKLKECFFPRTDITARVKTISGTSINNGATVLESSFSDDGIFKDITLSEDNYFATPNLICSTVNESAELSGAKSFRMDLTLISDKTNLSPVIDTERLSITCVSNRINSPSDENTARFKHLVMSTKLHISPVLQIWSIHLNHSR